MTEVDEILLHDGARGRVLSLKIVGAFHGETSRSRVLFVSRQYFDQDKVCLSLMLLIETIPMYSGLGRASQEYESIRPTCSTIQHRGPFYNGCSTSLRRTDGGSPYFNPRSNEYFLIEIESVQL